MVSKQPLPVFGKPMIQCLRSILTFAVSRNILITTTPQDQSLFRPLLGDGFGIGPRFSCTHQNSPRIGGDAEPCRSPRRGVVVFGYRLAPS
ncbi:hypothetical protein [Bradyrhizobium liaoningense]|uniref:hypothetical protein n=1 Tax=Bradyrhizobium liaoningense TaxID=43992 RepID=UPI0039088972